MRNKVASKGIPNVTINFQIMNYYRIPIAQQDARTYHCEDEED